MVHEASSSTVSENFPPAELVIFRRSLGLRESGTETGTPGTSGESTDFFLSVMDIARAGTGGGVRFGVDMTPTFSDDFDDQKQQKLERTRSTKTTKSSTTKTTRTTLSRSLFRTLTCLTHFGQLRPSKNLPKVFRTTQLSAGLNHFDHVAQFFSIDRHTDFFCFALRNLKRDRIDFFARKRPRTQLNSNVSPLWSFSCDPSPKTTGGFSPLAKN